MRTRDIVTHPYIDTCFLPVTYEWQPTNDIIPQYQLVATIVTTATNSADPNEGRTVLLPIHDGLYWTGYRAYQKTQEGWIPVAPFNPTLLP